ncbi:hypothetical protein [Hymenobacter latericus]|uniref:hypothetical protein n=1 Tax=Hymenobacter sp. YIM 151858-1 TaxID=2987688 RepID=UPI002226474F|nr:hypothetical protein [Hymenobacter sp. YIM 151858-1]UYZ59978.1 hypothetical protein OIS50_04080 [Hymenobacter sp. YIM 151858-1]
MAKVETVGQRFSQLIQTLGMSKNAFALSLDKTATVIQHIVEERNKPGFDLLCKVFEVYPNVSKEWMMQGFGQMFNDETPTERVLASARVEAVDLAPDEKAQQAAAAPVPANATQAASGQQTPIAAPSAAITSVGVSPEPAAAPAEAMPAAVPVAAAAPAPAQVVSLEAALYAQQLQHQLALAEMRNQHLQEQQKMMQQMVELMSRQLSR